MLVYTFDEDIKRELLEKGQILVKEQRIKDKVVFLFKVNDLSFIRNNFSHEENKKIFIYNNRVTF